MQKSLRIASVLFTLLLLLPIASAEKLADRLKGHVKFLSDKIGERNTWTTGSLESAADYIQKEFKKAGYTPEVLPYTVVDQRFKNIQAVKKGSSEIIIVGAHYDTVPGTPGADDNASGIAVLLELARLLAKQNLNKTVRFVAFSSEEPPYFFTEDMGSYRYAEASHDAQEKIVGMISLEMVGFYSDERSSQSYPFLFGLFRPSEANFISVVSDFGSRTWKDDVATALADGMLPVESAWLFRWIPGVQHIAQWATHS